MIILMTQKRLSIYCRIKTQLHTTVDNRNIRAEADCAFMHDCSFLHLMDVIRSCDAFVQPLSFKTVFQSSTFVAGLILKSDVCIICDNCNQARFFITAGL